MSESKVEVREIEIENQIEMNEIETNKKWIIYKSRPVTQIH